MKNMNPVKSLPVSALKDLLNLCKSEGLPEDNMLRDIVTKELSNRTDQLS